MNLLAGHDSRGLLQNPYCVLSFQYHSGGLIREELEKCDALLYTHLGITPKDFAYTNVSWSRIAEAEVKKRYRFARLWIIGTHYNTDEGVVRFAEIVGESGEDEEDGGPPYDSRYITDDSDPFRLPSMELQYLIYEFDAYQKYLEGALKCRVSDHLV